MAKKMIVAASNDIDRARRVVRASEKEFQSESPAEQAIWVQAKEIDRAIDLLRDAKAKMEAECNPARATWGDVAKYAKLCHTARKVIADFEPDRDVPF